MGLSRVSLGLDRHAQQTIHGGSRVAYGEWLKSSPRPCNTQDQGNREVWKGASRVTGVCRCDWGVDEGQTGLMWGKEVEYLLSSAANQPSCRCELIRLGKVGLTFSLSGALFWNSCTGILHLKSTYILWQEPGASLQCSWCCKGLDDQCFLW